MNDDINNMISCKIVLMKIVIQGKADIADWAITRRFFTKGCFSDFFEGKFCYADVWVVLNSDGVIKNKGRFKCIGIDPETNNEK